MQTGIESLFNTPKGKIIVALDGISTIHEAEVLIEKTSPFVGWYKAGLESIIGFGSRVMIDLIKSHGAHVFLDGKFHDIPQTVTNASGKAGMQHAHMIDVHCSNGVKAMSAALKENASSIILGITVLTSHTEEECVHIFGGGINETVLKFARDAKDAGLHGIVCSPKELEMLALYPELSSLLKITPGIQPNFMPKNDQERVMIPAEAIKLGATALVIGRAITKATNPGDAAKRIMEEIGEAIVA